MPDKPTILFVCLGNICRSPLAEAAFRDEAARAGLEAEVDSAGTGHWHVGNPPDKRAQALARRYGIEIGGYRARQVAPADFERFTHVVALDADNLAALRRMRPLGARADVSLLLDHVEGRAGEPVADPYYGDETGFETTWADVTSGVQALVSRLLSGKA
jgi:protein-tyrosine phosphatase